MTFSKRMPPETSRSHSEKWAYLMSLAYSSDCCFHPDDDDDLWSRYAIAIVAARKRAPHQCTGLHCCFLDAGTCSGFSREDAVWPGLKRAGLGGQCFVALREGLRCYHLEGRLGILLQLQVWLRWTLCKYLDSNSNDQLWWSHDHSVTTRSSLPSSVICSLSLFLMAPDIQRLASNFE